MAEIWEVFPAQMGEHRAFISFNSTFAEVAEQDTRTFLLRVRVEFPPLKGCQGKMNFRS